MANKGKKSPLHYRALYSKLRPDSMEPGEMRVVNHEPDFDRHNFRQLLSDWCKHFWPTKRFRVERVDDCHTVVTRTDSVQRQPTARHPLKQVVIRKPDGTFVGYRDKAYGFHNLKDGDFAEISFPEALEGWRNVKASIQAQLYRRFKGTDFTLHWNEDESKFFIQICIDKSRPLALNWPEFPSDFAEVQPISAHSRAGKVLEHRQGKIAKLERAYMQEMERQETAPETPWANWQEHAQGPSQPFSFTVWFDAGQHEPDMA